MLPDLSRLAVDTGAPKRPKRPYVPPPCPDELRYKEGEILNLNDVSTRITGGSSSFVKARDPRISYGQVVTKMQALSMVKHDRVITELYRIPPPSSPDSRPDEMVDPEAFRRAHDNTLHNQYYMHTMETDGVVSHIMTDGDFWEPEHKTTLPKAGQLAYTKGIIWTNTDPFWTWKSKFNATRKARCRIRLPPGSQIIIDRAPVYDGTDCTFDQHRISKFPDVLLLPGVFRVLKVKLYRSNNATYPAGDSSMYYDEDEAITPEYITPSTNTMKITKEEDFAPTMLQDLNEFADIELELVEQLRLEPRPLQ